MATADSESDWDASIDAANAEAEAPRAAAIAALAKVNGVNESAVAMKLQEM